MAVLSRGNRPRRGNRRPGWALLTLMLVLAIVASSALVFTDKVELLKLAVILSLWAAVVAAFVSVIYRRQSDMDAAKARDLKLVYDLQLDREISARREYELTVETQLRRELESELRARQSEEVSALRAELAALRTHLEILFDTDLAHRAAIETEPTGGYGEIAHDNKAAGRVTASRIDRHEVEDTDERAEESAEESPIIDVSAEPHPPETEWSPAPHERPTDQGRRHRAEERTEPRAPKRAPEPGPAAVEPEIQFPWMPTEEPAAYAPVPPRQEPSRPAAETRSGWQSAPAEGQWIPPGSPGGNSPGSNWSAGTANEYVGRRRRAEPGPPPAMTPPPPPTPPHSPPPPEPARGRHSAPPDAGDPRHPAPPAMATPPTPESPMPPEADSAPRHRGAAEPEGQHVGGQSVAELLARLEANGTGGGRRRRRE